jgi:hypothetical protein
VPIRVALVRLPRLLADLVAAAFVPEDDAHFDRIDDEADVELLGATRHDVVIAELDDPWHADVAALIKTRPDLVILGIQRDGRTAWIYELVPRPRRLDEVGPAQLRSTVLVALRATTT